jgi:hypothetical protein
MPIVPNTGKSVCAAAPIGIAIATQLAVAVTSIFAEILM